MASPGGAVKQGSEQARDFGDGQRDHAGVGRWRLARPDRGCHLGAGAVFDLGGGDGADGLGGHEHGVPGDDGVEPHMRLIEAEGVLAQPEVLFRQSSPAAWISRVRVSGWPQASKNSPSSVQLP